MDWWMCCKSAAIRESDYFYYVMELGDDVHAGQTIDPDYYQPRTLAQDLAERNNCPLANASGWARPSLRPWASCTSTV